MPNLYDTVPEGWELVPDRHGVLPFRSRFLFGPNDLAGICDLNVFAMPPPRAFISAIDQEVVEGQPLLLDLHEPEALRSTLAISSHLGTGKTKVFVELANARWPSEGEVSKQLRVKQPDGTWKTEHIKAPKLGPFKFPRILYISARRTFTTNLVSELNRDHDLMFKNYMTEEGKLSVNKNPRLFCQTESLWRFGEELNTLEALGEGVRTYDVIILDELESIVASFKPSITHGKDLIKNLRVFHALVKHAPIVIAGDAFLSKRSLDVLKELRGGQGHPLKLLVNHANPYDRIIKPCYVISTDKPSKHLSKEQLATWKPHENVVESIAAFHGKLVEDLRAGLKVVVVWGSVKAGLAFEQVVFNEFVKPTQEARATMIQRFWRWRKVLGKSKRRVLFLKHLQRHHATSPLPECFRYKFFHAGNKATPADLAKVDNTWSKLNLLMYSPTITVGVNYNPTDPITGEPIHCYQRLYIYACRYGATPRDMFQASLRVRVIVPPAVGEPHLIYVLDHRGGAPFCIGEERVEQRLNDIKSATTSAHNQLKLSLREVKQGLDGLNTTFKSADAPSWFNPLLIKNINEANVSSAFPAEIYDAYLNLCGYRNLNDQPEFKDEPIYVKKLERFLPYHDVPLIGEDQVNHLNNLNISTDESISPLQKLSINKYHFHKRLGLPIYNWTMEADSMQKGWYGTPLELPCTPDCVREMITTYPFKQKSWGEAAWELLRIRPEELETTEQEEKLNAFMKEQHAAYIAGMVVEFKHTHVPTQMDWPDWCYEPGLLDALWRGTAIKCLEGCELEHKHIKSNSDDGFCDCSKQFKHIALSKMPSHEQVLQAALNWDFKEGGDNLGYASSNYAAKVEVIRLLVKELGLTHAGQAKTWTQGEFNAIITKITEERTWEDIEEASNLRTCSLIDRALFVFALRQRDGRAKGAIIKDRELSAPELIGDQLSRIFHAWCLSSVDVAKEHREVKSGEGKGTLRTPSKARHEGAPEFNTWQKAGSPQREAAKGAVGDKWPDQLKWLKAKYDADFPLATPLTGVSLVPWGGFVVEEEGAAEGEGLLWNLVLPHVVSVQVMGPRGKLVMKDHDME